MCGLTGWIGTDAPTDLFSRFADATDLLRHRGPDDEGFVWLPASGGPPVTGSGPDTPESLALRPWRSIAGPPSAGGILLGHRRLAILDLSPGGHQPMSADDGRLWVAYNGEIYNFTELRDQLKPYHEFRTASDTEVLLAAYRHWGLDCVRRFVGMFAFAIADRRQPGNPVVHLARDPFGIKPLYYAALGQSVVFASEIKALLALGVPARINPVRLQRYLEDGITDYGADTLFHGIHQVPPAHTLTLQPGPPDQSAAPTNYWEPPVARPAARISMADSAASLREALLQSVRLHVRSDVPLGTALSGGLDSSSIVAAVRAVDPSARIEAFGYVADDASISEEKWMTTAATAVGATLHRCHSQPDFLATRLDQLVFNQDLPFSSTSIAAQWHVFQAAAAAGIKVMLDGQGADEMLAGYGGYPARRLESLVRSGHLAQAARFWQLAGRSHGHRTMAVQLGGYLAPRSAVGKAKFLAGRGGAAAALDHSWFARHAGGSDIPPRIPGPDRLRSELWHSLRTSSLPMLLRYEDRNSMAHSVESRVPFLTRDLAELIFSFPEECLVDNAGTTKSVLRHAMRGLIPDTILDRRDKIGFATPEQQWLAIVRPWVEQQLSLIASGLTPALRHDVVLGQWQSVLAGRGRFDFRFWRWINLVAWTRTFNVSFR